MSVLVQVRVHSLKLCICEPDTLGMVRSPCNVSPHVLIASLVLLRNEVLFLYEPSPAVLKAGLLPS